MRVCILENDRLPEGLAPPGVRFADYYVRMLQAADPTIACDIFHTPAGEYPADFTRYDGVVLTGSHADAFSDAPWTVELRRRVSALIASGTKVVGICFGHQILAMCLGAPVGRAECGFTVGRVAYRWHGAPGSGAAAGYGLLASHQDQVKALPEGATLLASSDACPIAGFTHGTNVLSMQPHPELDEAIVANIIDMRRDVLGAAGADAAMATLKTPHEGAAIGAMIVAFLRGEAVRAAA